MNTQNMGACPDMWHRTCCNQYRYDAAPPKSSHLVELDAGFVAVLTARRLLLVLLVRSVAILVALVPIAVACGPPPSAEPTACAEDDYELNDTAAAAYELPLMKDDPNSTTDIIDLTVHTTHDKDWFRVRARDTGMGGDPIITATIPSTNFDITAWFVCDGDSAERLECKFGSETSEPLDGAHPLLNGCQGTDTGPELDDNGNEIIGSGGRAVQMTTDCSDTSNDDGVLYVRVKSLAPSSKRTACSYSLSVTVE